jgi:NAD(P)-dependent dehydrogenase (short-subunit alcohol dehydrogenase family)
VITGANKGIGWEMVRLLAEQQPSATILLGSRSQANGDAAVQKLPEAARKQVKVLVIDVTDDASVKAAAEKVKAEYGRVDILVNNAGIASHSFDYESAKSTFETNVYGVKRVTDAFLPLVPEGSGHISIVSSEVGTWSHYFAPAKLQAQLEDASVQWSTIDSIAQAYLAAAKDPKHAGIEAFPSPESSFGSYGFSKALVSTYGRLLGRDLKPKGIPVLLSTPGYCATDLNANSGFRTAAQGGASCLMVLKRGVADSGKLFLDDEDQGLKNDTPDYVKNMNAKPAEK